MRAAQILIAIPPGSDDNAKKRLATLADSLYGRIQKGDDFGMLARSFSNDVMSATSGGSMQEFGIGSFDPAFENAVFALPADGTISKPFLTNHGYHIVKRIALTMPPTVKDKKNLDLIRQLVETDGRINVAKERMFNKMLSKTGYTEYQYDQQMLKQFLDSVLSGLPPSPSNPVTKSTALFKIGATQKLAGDFATYAVSNRYRTDGSGVKTYTVLFDEYKRNTVMQYYRDHLEEYNEDFNRQMKELKDGNLFFDIMMREIWSQAQSDTSGQKDFFTRNKAKYTWQQSADAVMFYCGDEETAGIFKMQLGKNPGLWRETLEMYSDKVTSDSSRFDTKKIPGFPKTVSKPGFLTATIVNKEDKTASFAYVFKYYTQPAAKTFDEARGDVIADYQEALDKKWITDLKKKYPVKVNEEELKKLLK
jgi:peptidyl-prolyl cis-trans isomerase SurA